MEKRDDVGEMAQQAIDEWRERTGRRHQAEDERAALFAEMIARLHAYFEARTADGQRSWIEL